MGDKGAVNVGNKQPLAGGHGLPLYHSQQKLNAIPLEGAARLLLPCVLNLQLRSLLETSS